MLYSLPNGKVLNLTVDQVLFMTDDDFRYLMANNAGDDIGDPFHQSSMDLTSLPDELDLDELDEEEVKDLTMYDDAEKLSDVDYYPDDLDL